MNEWVEERCEAIRLALRIPVGSFPVERDLYRLVEWYGGNVVLRHAPVPVAGCAHREDGRSVITLPERLNGRLLNQTLCHEIGHALLSMGMGSLLRQWRPEDLRAERLARCWDRTDEMRAREFVMAWFLPSRLVARLGDEELAWRSHCSLEMARARRESLGGRVVELDAPPRWSGSREYVVMVQRGSDQPLLYSARRGGGPEPVFVFPVGRSEEVPAAALQLGADLVALTAPEFETKYAQFRCERPETVAISMEALREWAG